MCVPVRIADSAMMSEEEKRTGALGPESFRGGRIEWRLFEDDMATVFKAEEWLSSIKKGYPKGGFEIDKLDRLNVLWSAIGGCDFHVEGASRHDLSRVMMCKWRLQLSQQEN